MIIQATTKTSCGCCTGGGGPSPDPTNIWHHIAVFIDVIYAAAGSEDASVGVWVNGANMGKTTGLKSASWPSTYPTAYNMKAGVYDNFASFDQPTPASGGFRFADSNIGDAYSYLTTGRPMLVTDLVYKEISFADFPWPAGYQGVNPDTGYWYQNGIDNNFNPPLEGNLNGWEIIGIETWALNLEGWFRCEEADPGDLYATTPLEATDTGYVIKRVGDCPRVTGKYNFGVEAGGSLSYDSNLSAALGDCFSVTDQRGGVILFWWKSSVVTGTILDINWSGSGRIKLSYDDGTFLLEATDGLSNSDSFTFTV